MIPERLEKLEKLHKRLEKLEKLHKRVKTVVRFLNKSKDPDVNISINGNYLHSGFPDLCKQMAKVAEEYFTNELKELERELEKFRR